MSRKRSGGGGKKPEKMYRVPVDLADRVRGLSEKSRLSDTDVVRLSLERGLSVVEKMFEQPTEKAA